jgi:CBS-domain-containing membrane protein
MIVGHFLSALTGIGITKLFALLPPARFEDLRWLAGALAVATCSVIMSVTKTIHPPAGATALLAATSPEITRLGWYLLALVLLGSTLMLASACIINNIHRQFPVYWWTPVDLSNSIHRRASSGIEKLSHVEKDGAQSDADIIHLRRVKTQMEMHYERDHQITMTATRVTVPDWLEMNDWERNVLEILRERLRVTSDNYGDWNEHRGRNSDVTAVSSGEEKLAPPI